MTTENIQAACVEQAQYQPATEAKPVAAAVAHDRPLDLLDEIECDLKSLFGRASIEGHEAGQRLAEAIKKKIQRYRAAAPQQPAPAVGEDAVRRVAGWISYVDGVKSQNFARDKDELANLKRMASLMKMDTRVEYLPVYFYEPEHLQTQPQDAAIALQAGEQS